MEHLLLRREAGGEAIVRDGPDLGVFEGDEEATGGELLVLVEVGHALHGGGRHSGGNETFLEVPVVALLCPSLETRIYFSADRPTLSKQIETRVREFGERRDR